MANSPQLGGGTPPIPQQPNPVQQAPGQAPQGPAVPPPPSHQETVAAMRHFDAIKGELTTILRDPALGKSDLKDAIINGVTGLVATRIISAPEAVAQLTQVPSDPLAQRKWIQTQMDNATQSENVVLEHYRQGKAAAGNMAIEVDHGKPDDHMKHMASIRSNYAGAKA